ncbi:MAG: sulfatase-like hydrolase/transferase [Candidatus Scalinduaceae bacterium]
MQTKKDFLKDIIHIFILSNFAFAQPLFDLLSRQAEFFTIRRSEPVDIILLVFCLVILLPSLLILVEFMVGLLSRRVRKSVHGFLVAVLLTAIILPALKKLFEFNGTIQLIGAAILGITFTVTYIRFHLVRTFLTILSPALLLFPFLFIFNSPVYKVVFVKNYSEIVNAKVNSTTPVVMVVFDEFPVTSLMDEHHQIDPIRYPNFAALAKEAYWFRNTTTVSVATHIATPAILTGNYPPFTGLKRLPTATDYPKNLFTLLGNSYNLNVFESITHLCPDRLRANNTFYESLVERIFSLLSDISIVYLHLLLPADLSTGLPVITQDWKNFMSPAVKLDNDAQKKNPVAPDRLALFKKFIESFHLHKQPTLFFLHSIFPHRPWIYLPSGKIYDNTVNTPTRWGNDEVETIHYFQRHLLQVGFVDKLLGKLVAKLKEVGLYDRSLIVITADHGVSFWPNDESRELTKSNYQDILSVPLFIKKPYQHKSVISDRKVETSDILPTIAEVLDINLPWTVDGTSALKPRPSEKTEIAFTAHPKEQIIIDSDFETKHTALERKLSLFGSGTNPNGMFKFGIHNKLVGKRLNDIQVSGIENVEVEIDSINNYANVNPEANFLPSLIKGRIITKRNLSGSFDLAISVNGTIRTTTQTFLQKGNVAKFSAILPDKSFRINKNDVEVIVLSRTKQEPRLTHTKNPSTANYYLSVSSGKSRENIITSDGKPIPVIPGTLKGHLDIANVNNDGYITFVGWAADVKNSRLPKTILIFVNGKFFYSGHTDVYRRGVAKLFTNNALQWSGFRYEFPLAQFKDRSYNEVRFFAVSKNGVASELNYHKGYKWGKKKKP